jgi:hypothetical protein
MIALSDRFWSKVDKTDTCWLWTSSISPDGYGRILRADEFSTTLPHRISFEAHVRAIPDGMELDHLCSVRNCVNPEHLEVVTHAENIRRATERRTECRNGHPVVWQVSDYRGGRRCLVCRRAANAASARRRRARIAHPTHESRRTA